MRGIKYQIPITNNQIMTNIPMNKILYTATLIIAKAVIPAPYQVRDKLQQESRKTLDSPVSSTGQAQSSPE
jgi:hypothetical protein